MPMTISANFLRSDRMRMLATTQKTLSRSRMKIMLRKKINKKVKKISK
jgi:hypothetical protein